MKLSDKPSGPRGGQVACSGCGAPLDPLRAGHVAIFSSQFHFFCNHATCRASFLGEPPQPPVQTAPAPPPEPRRTDIDAVIPPVRAATANTLEEAVPERIVVDDEGDLIEPVMAPVLSEKLPMDAPERRDVGLMLVALTLIAGVLAMALEFAESVRFVAVARVVLLGVGSFALIGRALTARPEPALPHRIVILIAPLLATLVSLAALVLASAEGTARASFLAGTILTAAAVNLWLVGLARRPIHAGRRWVQRRLDVAGTRVTGEPSQVSPKELAYDIKPGEHVLVESGETTPVDLEITDGEVELLPWVGAATCVRRRPGDTVVAGSRVTAGQMRGKCTAAGDDRALARPLLAAARRADVHAQLPRIARSISERWAPVAALVSGGALALMGWGALDSALVVVAVYAAFGNVAVGSMAGLAVARGVRWALGRGAVYNDAKAWDRCARVTAAIFCARGTLLRGEPELTEVEVFRRAGKGDTADDVLSLGAGVLAGERSPVAVAVRRAARDRGLTADPGRNPRSIGGRGVTAVAATGAALCIGNRELLLERGISVAAAESKINELESIGRTVLLVAKAGRMIGLLALQDGLRSGARAAVQHLLDAKVEPVLMSADARDTCEALGRALDIDHLRPEVLDDARRGAVERIRDTGATVAVLGHTPYDDEALRAADAAVALAEAGSGRDEFAVSLVSDDVRDAALAIALAHRTRYQATVVQALTLAPAALGVLVVVVALLPPEYAPLAQLLGAVAAVWHLRLQDRASS